jgi:hypothetical protein
MRMRPTTPAKLPGYSWLDRFRSRLGCPALWRLGWLSGVGDTAQSEQWGLSVAYSMVSLHDGYLRSMAGRGMSRQYRRENQVRLGGA